MTRTVRSGTPTQLFMSVESTQTTAQEELLISTINSTPKPHITNKQRAARIPCIWKGLHWSYSTQACKENLPNKRQCLSSAPEECPYLCSQLPCFVVERAIEKPLCHSSGNERGKACLALVQAHNGSVREPALWKLFTFIVNNIIILHVRNSVLDKRPLQLKSPCWKDGCFILA